MNQPVFARREVDRAFRKFRDLVQDLYQTDHHTWGDRITHLLNHCEQNPVMKVITEPLRRNQNVDAGKWYDEYMMQESRPALPYRLPLDDEDCAALIYQFLLLLEYEEERIDLVGFCYRAFGTSKHADSIRRFNAELVSKFTREIGYRLDEILEDIGGATEVPAAAMIVFHHYDNSMNIHGNIQGSNVAGGGSNVSGSTATFTTTGDLADALKALKPLVQGVVAEQRQAVEAALTALVSAAETDSVPQEQIASAAATVAAASPPLRDRLKEIAGKLGLNLASSGIVQGLKMAFGIH